MLVGAGSEYLTNECATVSDIILAGALGGIGGGVGKLALLRHGRRSLTRVTGKEWSHAIPSHWTKHAPDRIKAFLNRRGGLNGSWVSPKRHFKHDPYRYPKGYKQFGNRFYSPLQKLDRIPDWMKAASAAGTMGSNVAGRNCGC
jgi:hypothetical protein